MSVVDATEEATDTRRQNREENAWLPQICTACRPPPTADLDLTAIAAER